MAIVVFDTGGVVLFGSGDFDKLDALCDGLKAVQAAVKDVAALAGGGFLNLHCVAAQPPRPHRRKRECSLKLTVRRMRHFLTLPATAWKSPVKFTVRRIVSRCAFGCVTLR